MHQDQINFRIFSELGAPSTCNQIRTNRPVVHLVQQTRLQNVWAKIKWGSIEFLSTLVNDMHFQKFGGNTGKQIAGKSLIRTIARLSQTKFRERPTRIGRVITEEKNRIVNRRLDGRTDGEHPTHFMAETSETERLCIIQFMLCIKVFYFITLQNYLLFLYTK